MDPYLEHPDIFPDLHDRLNNHLSEAIQALLPPPYFAVIGRRVWVEVSKRYIGPDVQVAYPTRPAKLGAAESGCVALAPSRTKPKVVRIPHDERREPFLEIYVGSSGDKRLVTTIETLSLTNKTPGEHGRELYLKKQREVLASRTHLVEIDLLRAGEHTTAVPLAEALAETGPFDYHVCVHQYDKLEEYFVYAIRLEDRLPEIAVPLLPGDPAVPVDLQAVFDRCYDAGPYRREIDYANPEAAPPLGERAEWARNLLSARL
jgi:hypothetical protein